MILHIDYFPELVGENIGHLLCSNCHTPIRLISPLQAGKLACGAKMAILCADCRQRACRRCGTVYTRELLIRGLFKNNHICYFCLEEAGRPKRRRYLRALLTSSSNLHALLQKRVGR